MQRTACRGAPESVHIGIVFTEAHQKLEMAAVMSAMRLLSFGEGPNEDRGKPGLTVKQSSSPKRVSKKHWSELSVVASGQSWRRRPTLP